MSVDFKTFENDWHDFMEKLKSRSFWELPPEKRDAWFGGLGWAYIMLAAANEQETRRAIQMFTAISEEYARRNAHVLVHGLPNLGKSTRNQTRNASLESSESSAPKRS